MGIVLLNAAPPLPPFVSVTLHCIPLRGLAVEFMGRVSLVGIATRYGLDGPGIQSRWWRDFPHPSTPALGPPSLLYSGYPVFFLGVKWPGCDVDRPLFLTPRWKSRAIHLLPIWVHTAHFRMKITFIFITILLLDQTIARTMQRKLIDLLALIVIGSRLWAVSGLANLDLCHWDRLMSYYVIFLWRISRPIAFT